jgi:hypothetical protein
LINCGLEDEAYSDELGVLAKLQLNYVVNLGRIVVYIQ